MVSESLAARTRSLYASATVHSSTVRKRVPIWTPSAPSMNAAAKPRPSATPPAPMTGMETASRTDSRFGEAAGFRARLEALTGRPVIDSITAAERVGPERLFDALVIAPCTGNTLAKLAAGITDTAVTMAAKSHLRNGGPVVVALSTNDALSGSAPAIAALLNRKNYYFVPFGQDDPEGKPTSLQADFTKIAQTVDAALAGRQLQPILR